jgi:hypothetical protein
MTLRADGKVGIGTVSPKAVAHVGKLSANSGTFNDIPQSNMGISATFPDSTRLWLSNRTSATGEDYWGMALGTKYTGDIYIQSVNKNSTAIYDLLLQPNGGNVGIGLTGPESKLHIYGSDNPLMLQSQRSPYPKLSYDFSGTNAENFQFYDHHGSGRGFLYGRKYTTGTNPNANAGWHFYGNDSTLALRIDGSANVGIGTNNPRWGLEVTPPTGKGGVLSCSDSAIFSHNLYYSGGWKYGAASKGGAYMRMIDSEIQFWNAPNSGSGTWDTAGGTATTTQRMTIDESGNVGIGTASPARPLTIESSSFDGIRVKRTIAGGGSAIELINGNDDEWTVGISGTGTFGIYDGATFGEQFAINTSGNVGIGTTSPTQTLDVNGSVRQRGVNTYLDWTTRRIIMNYDNTYRQGIHFSSSNREMTLFSTTGDSGGSIIFKTRAGGGSSDTDYGTERMRITGGGLVGIGTTSPASPLHIISSDTNANAHFTSLVIDHNCSGGGTNTGDFSHTGILIDLDSTATGGTTSNEHRMYGIRSDTRHSGDSDLVYGMYSYTRSDHTSGTTTLLKAAEFIAVASGTGTNTHIYGLNSYALKDSGSTGTTTNMFGVRAEVEVDAGTCTNAYAYQAHIDRDGGTITTGYLYYGSYSGTVGTKYGVYVTGETKNYFSGKVGIGTNNPGYKLEVNGTSQFNSEMRWSLGTTSHAGYSTNKDWYIRSGVTTGKVILQDTGGNVGVGTNNPTAKLHVNGYIKNGNPVFHAYRNSAWTTGGYATIPFNIQVHDSTNSYNTNGTFTAPVAGYYFFSVFALTNGNINIHLEFHKNGALTNGAEPFTGALGSHACVSGSIVIYLNVNDYVEVVMVSGAMYGVGNHHNGFCGYLIG